MERSLEDRIMRLWDYGLATPAIAERFGISVERVRRVLRTGGVDLRSMPRQRYDCCGGLHNGATRTSTGIKDK